MPLVRVQVRNEYGLGLPELYKGANKEDPKAVLDGVAVSGLVGILRQLGDLAEFAAEVFHGLQEQMISTASRSHKLVVRVQHIEAALLPLERTILAQRSHLHFAYTPGSDWRACIQNEQNQFIYNDLPRFIMESYEECRDAPRLHLLDKFDSGGPGSCLKRYSDPTFFKREWGSLDKPNAEKTRRNKKVHRSKQKRMWKGNGDISRGASISNDSGRMQFTSLNIDKQTSSQTISAFDVTLKSELDGQSNSFDSRTESGYAECVFQPSNSVKPEDYEAKEMSSFELKMHQNNTLNSAFADGQSRNEDDDFPQSSSQEQTGLGSSRVTWDEKTQIVDPTSEQFDTDESPEGLPANFDLNIQQIEALNSESVNQMDFKYDKETTPKPISGGYQLDDIESEPENYMDALNTIESECETDLDCQTKREMEQCSSYNDEGIKDGKTCHGAHTSDGNSESNFESHTAADKETNGDKLNLVSSESHTHEQSPQMAIRSTVPSDNSNIDYHGSVKILDMESTVSSASSGSGFQETNSQAPTGDKIASSCEPRKPPAELSRANSVTFWTNGGLLGLEPSKPPDFSTMNAVSQDSVGQSKGEKTVPSCQTNILMDNGHAGNSYIAVKSSENFEQSTSSEYSKSCYNDQEGTNSIERTFCRFSSANLDVKREKSGDSNHSSRFDYINGHSLKETVVLAGARQPATPDSKTLSTRASQDDGENSCQMFGFSHGLLVNGFQRKVSLLHDENSESAWSAKTGVFEQKSSNQSVACQTSEAHFNKHFRSTVTSPSSSPTLEHMKISFQPMNGSEISKLTLKFPDQNYCHESSSDLFTSFQLVPESAIPLHGGDSHSDDDTFCRSSLYASDDCLSHLSESHSEQWESDETPQDPDPDRYDAFCGISSTKSVSSSVELEATVQGSIDVHLGVQRLYAENDVDPSQSDHLLDLPIFDALNPLFKQEVRKDSDAENLQDSCFNNEHMPQPPPLPPLEWRVNKSHLDVAEDKQDTVSEALNYSPDMKPLEPTINMQLKPSLVKQKNFEEVIAFSPNSKQPEQQKQNGQKENQPENGKGMEEKEDFLHQIRAKSLSLRRTVPAKQTFTPGPATNVKVSAILEKANAIRQAVASDDGEDNDNWSDS